MDNEYFLSLFLAVKVALLDSIYWKRNIDGLNSDAKGRKIINKQNSLYVEKQNRRL